jgi:hypothetical protein
MGRIYAVGALALLLAAGCASKPRLRTPDLGPDRGTIPRADRSTAEKLPGADRVYPSQEDDNQAAAGAPEAFPKPREAAPDPAAATGRGAPKPAAASRAAGADGLSNLDPDAVMARRKSGVPDAGPIEIPKPLPPDAKVAYSVQLYAGTSFDISEERRKELQSYFEVPLRIDSEGGLYKVRAGRFRSREDAEETRRTAASIGIEGAFVVAVAAESRR